MVTRTEYDIINIDNDGGGKVHGYTNYRNIFQEGTKSDCECITHDDNNRWTTPTFEASLEYWLQSQNVINIYN